MKIVRTKMLKKKVLILLFTFNLVLLNAQSFRFKSKVSDYSDSEIIELIQKAEKAGITESQVIELARAQGMSESELELFRSKALQLRGLTSNSLFQIPVKSESISRLSNSIENKSNIFKSNGIDTIKQSELKLNLHKSPIIPRNLNFDRYNNQIEYVSNSWDLTKIFDEKRFPTFANGRTIKAPDQYIIGVGDEVSVTVFGNSYFNKVSRVDERGRIDLGTTLGKVYVKGLEFGKLEKVVSAAIGQKINLGGNELEVDLSFSRQISVNVSGEVLNPGTYQLPAANTLFNLLVLSGGPTSNGSVREIEVVRSGKIAFKFDLYQFLINPQHNSFLEDGDYIVIKPIHKVVELGGGVIRKGKIELLDNEDLNNAITYAGGITSYADLSRVTISRINGRDRTLLQLDIRDKTKVSLEPLKNGDQIIVFEQTDILNNQVIISGEVYFPGKYALNKGMNVKELLSNSGGLTPESNKNLAFVIRSQSDGTYEFLKLYLDDSELTAFKLENKDHVVIFPQSRFIDPFQVEIRGEVRNPIKIDYRKGLTLNVLLDFSGGLKYSADATEVEILRSAVYTSDFKPGERNRTVSIKAIYNPNNKGVFEDIELMAEDIVIVRKVSNLNDRIGVSIVGEVMHPGLFVMAKNENRVKDLIEKGGGLTEFAFPEAAQLFRKDGQQLVFDLQSVVRNKNSEFNYRLEDGDRLVIPLKQDLVILPNTDTLLNKAKIFAPYISGKRASFYLKNYSLGFDDQHRKKRLYLQEPGGKIKRSKNYGLFVITPKVKAGSEIYFQPSPKKIVKNDGDKKPTDWNRVIENFTVKLTGIATLWVLLSRI